MNRIKKKQRILTDKDPLWYKNAIIYEVHVRAFFDSDADGAGDFRGLTEKLGYLQDLGVTAIWLLPFYPSPLKDDGYDIADYYCINSMYGTLADFKTFLREAHGHGLRVITELVLNHTSDQHPWFQQSRRARPGSSKRDFYVWSDTPEKYSEARIIFKDFEPSNWTWDPVARAYFWHRFYSHQPDLNFDNPDVHAEMLKVIDFWLDLGVDGLRLDAVPYLYEREHTSCENLKETHDYLKSLRRHVDERYGDRMLLAEANQWPEDAVTYFGSGKGDECHMAFHFPLMPRLFMAVRMEDRVPIVDILEQTPPIPETSHWALFLRNHDELTLEMVTDEERDYMYRVYARDAKARINLGIRRRLAPLLGNDRRRVELLNMLLLSLPGTPVLYYGDEIGMGDNVFLGDRNGVRTPMQWSADKNAGFSRASPQALYLPVILDPEYHYEAVNVETQQRNPHSLFWWMKRLLALRKRWKALGNGTLEFLQPDNRKVLAFIRRHQAETVLVVANLSRFSQSLQLDLATFQGRAPVELFGNSAFPLITGEPYPLTLSPHAVFWFSLESPVRIARTGPGLDSPQTIAVAEGWEELVLQDPKARLEQCLQEYVIGRKWFRSHERQIRSVRIREAIPLPSGPQTAYLILLLVDYAQGDPEEYLLPIAVSSGKTADNIRREQPDAVIALVQSASRSEPELLHDATASKEFERALLEGVVRRRRWRGAEGEVECSSSHALRTIGGDVLHALDPSPARDEQRNTSVVFGDQFILKLFRRLEPGVHPELEIGRFLEKKSAPIARVAGALEYRRNGGETLTVGVMHRLIPNSQNAWAFTQDHLTRYLERVRSLRPEAAEPEFPVIALLNRAQAETPAEVVAAIGTYLESARLLGQRTGELHQALAEDGDNKEFAPEAFTPFYQRSLSQSMRNLMVQNFQLLRRHMGTLPAPAHTLAEQVLACQDRILKRFRALYEIRISAMRIRGHGSFHLGEVLYTGKDFVIIDFEGELDRPLGQRRLKRSPLRDVVGIIRSFDYATHVALSNQVELGIARPEQLAALAPWTRYWLHWVSAVFLRAYLAVVAGTNLLPKAKPELATLLEAYVLDKAIYEVGYELDHRTDWVTIPLQSILEIVGPPGPAAPVT